MTENKSYKEGQGVQGQRNDAMAPRKTMVILVLILGLLVIGSVVMMLMPKRAEVLPVAVPVALPVVVQEVVLTNLHEQVVYSGRIEAEQDVSLAVDDNGRIVWLGATQGDRVKAGDVLLRLDDAKEKASVSRAEVEFRQSEGDLERWEAMKKAGAVSAQDYETMRNRRDIAKIVVEETRGLLAKRMVVSPVDGVVNDRLVEVGEMAMPGKPAFRVVRADAVKVLLDIPERDVASMKVGMPLGFTVDALPGAGLTGVVAFVAAAAEAASLTFRLELRAENPEGRIKPGMIARVSLRRGERQGAVVVPLQALIPDQGQYVAYVVEDSRAVRHVVKLAAVVDTLAVVQDGLHPGDRVVVEGQRLATDGISVKVMP